MKKMLIVGVAAAALAAAVNAHAAAGLGIRGETGLARTPMAASLPPMSLALAADYIAADNTFIPMRAQIGIIEGLEVGGHWWYLDIPGDATAWGLNAKYVFPRFVEHLDLAVGGHYKEQTIDDENNDGHDVYFVASFPVGFLVPSLGVMYESITGDNDESDLRFFGSIVANVLPTFSLGAEIMSASDKLDRIDNPDPVMWFGARFMPLHGLTVQAGVLNYADLDPDLEELEEFAFHVGLQYEFSFQQ